VFSEKSQTVQIITAHRYQYLVIAQCKLMIPQPEKPVDTNQNPLTDLVSTSPLPSIQQTSTVSMDDSHSNDTIITIIFSLLEIKPHKSTRYSHKNHSNLSNSMTMMRMILDRIQLNSMIHVEPPTYSLSKSDIVPHLIPFQNDIYICYRFHPS